MSAMAIFRQSSGVSACLPSIRGVNIHRVDEQRANSEQDNERRQKRSFRLYIGDAGWFAFTYAIAFIAFRLDIRRHGPSFQHPMTTWTSAWVALLIATVLSVYWKIRHGGQ
jgi:hypothetical protein